MNSINANDQRTWLRATAALALWATLTLGLAAMAQAGRLTDNAGQPVISGTGDCVHAAGGSKEVFEKCGDQLPVEPPLTTEVEVVVAKTAATVTAKTLERISIAASMLFAFDSAELSDDAKAVIDERIESIGGEARLTSIMRVVGHTDSSGPEAYNQKLSERRAKAVADYIVARGQHVTAADIDVVGMGEADPVDSNATPEGRANNRRVDIFAEAEMER